MQKLTSLEESIALDEIRSHFPQCSQDPSFCYLDSAATTLKPSIMIDAIADFYRNRYATVHRSIYPVAQSATDRYEEVRQQIASLFGCEADQIIFTKGTTEAINLLTHTLGMICRDQPARNQIFLERSAHHANFVPWQLGQKLFPFDLHFRHREEFEKGSLALDKGLLALSLAHISNVTGLELDFSNLAHKVKKLGGYTLVDGAQGFTSLLTKSAKERKEFLEPVDAYCFSAHKVYGPSGLGVLYLSRSLLEKLGPYQGGGEMIDQVALSGTSFAPAPLLFEAGTPPISAVIGFGASLDFLSRIDLRQKFKQLSMMRDRFVKDLQAIPQVQMVLGEHIGRGSVIANFTINGAHPLDVATLLGHEGVALRSGHHCAQVAMRDQGIEHSLRLSLGIYNTEEEIDRALDALKRAVKSLL